MDQQAFFFVHVMKTGGTTIRAHVNNTFAPHERYPEGSIDEDLVPAKLSVHRLLALPPERHAEIRIYTGHFPFFAVASSTGRCASSRCSGTRWSGRSPT